MFYLCYYLSKGIRITEVNPITELNHICLHAEVGGEGGMYRARLISPLLRHLDLPSITQIAHFQLFPPESRDPNRIYPNEDDTDNSHNRSGHMLARSQGARMFPTLK